MRINWLDVTSVSVTTNSVCIQPEMCSFIRTLINELLPM